MLLSSSKTAFSITNYLSHNYLLRQISQDIDRKYMKYGMDSFNISLPHNSSEVLRKNHRGSEDNIELNLHRWIQCKLRDHVWVVERTTTGKSLSAAPRKEIAKVY